MKKGTWLLFLCLFTSSFVKGSNDFVYESENTDDTIVFVNTKTSQETMLTEGQKIYYTSLNKWTSYYAVLDSIGSEKLYVTRRNMLLKKVSDEVVLAEVGKLYVYKGDRTVLGYTLQVVGGAIMGLSYPAQISGLLTGNEQIFYIATGTLGVGVFTSIKGYRIIGTNVKLRSNKWKIKEIRT
jgi:hypothetical protein